MISVIIPLYNKEPIIERSLQSVLGQDYDDFEVVVVNDGSTDRSADIVRSINDPRIRLIEQENGGPSKARNTGTKNARGEWIVFLDADDELLPGAMRMFSTTIESYSNYNFHNYPWFIDNGRERTKCGYTNREKIENPFKKYYYKEINPRTGSYVLSKDLARKCLFNESLHRYEDDEMLFRVFHKAQIMNLPEPCMVCNTKYASASHGRKNIQEDFLGHLDFSNKSFWERMCIYKFFLSERPHYPEQCKKLYPNLYKRYDMLLLIKILDKL